jgi:phosphoribosylamine--glycine ligase
MKPLKILLLGSGGREHALAWKISQSPLCEKLFIAPGNAGTAQCGENVHISFNDFVGIQSLCLREHVDMVLVGPEEPLVNGIVDYFKADAALKHIPVIGPSKEAAQLEGSKAFAKAFMQRHGIPTAAYREFDASNYEEGVAYLRAHALPIVLKADGLAAGKGVIICQNHVEAMAEFELMIQESKFGTAGHTVVVEEFLTGIELSVFAVVDGKSYVLLPEAKDYKRIGEGDTGLNTGGMGAVSPVPFADAAFMEKVRTRIVEPTVKGLQDENLDYKGFVFFGLISVNGEPFVIEYNCRMGDPETEVVIPRLQNDLVDILLSVHQQRLSEVEIKIDPRAAATVVAVSGGYPGQYQKGYPIDGLDTLLPDDMLLFHAGTALEDQRVVTNGGRVLALTSFAETVVLAANRSTVMYDFISFEDMYYRMDIGYEFWKGMD